MQITKITASAGSAPSYPGGAASAIAALNDDTGRVALGDQLRAYQSLAGQWRSGGGADRSALAQALTASPFAERVQSTLDAFTRAAWAGSGAQPPEPERRLLQAFDALSEGDRQIVAAMRSESAGSAGALSPDRYRAQLEADLERAEAAAFARRSDVVTLSAEARARLNGEEIFAEQPSTERSDPPQRPEVAAAFAAYARAAR